METLASYTDLGTAAAAKATAQLHGAGRDKAKAAAQDFEAVLVGQLMGLMLESVPTDGPFGGGNGEDIYRGMLAEQMGREIAKRGGLGLSPMIMNEIIRMQQAATPGSGQ